MLTFKTPGSRREFLRIGTAAVGGLTLSQLLSVKSQAANLTEAVRDKCVVVLNLQGGPTQFETFDPKMTAPQEIRSITGEIPTSIPGVTYGGTFPKLAGLAKEMAVVRSYRHGISSHGPAAMHVMAGGNPTGAMMGALYARVTGLTNPLTGMPLNTLVTTRSIGEQFKHLYHNPARVSQTGSLSSVYKPFDPSGGGELVENMTLRLGQDRLADRRHVLGRLDELRRRLDATDALAASDRFQQQAFDVLMKGVSQAFDISREPAEVLAKYDTGDMEPSDAVKKRNGYATQFSPVALGKQMLLARRLVEAGCGFVTVTCGGWDMHGGGKEFTMADGLGSLVPAVDKAASAFIEDIRVRGLSKRVLLVITGEFGRTPRINKNGGRDHWGNLCTLAFIGGGLPMGQVIGKSDRIAGQPASDPISSKNVLATIMHTLFDVGEVRLLSNIPKDVESVITTGQPIRELIG